MREALSPRLRRLTALVSPACGILTTTNGLSIFPASVDQLTAYIQCSWLASVAEINPALTAIYLLQLLVVDRFKEWLAILRLATPFNNLTVELMSLNQQ